MCFLNPSKINALCSEIDRSSLSIFKKSVNPSVEKLLLHLKEKHAHNLMATDPFIVSAPAQLERF